MKRTHPAADDGGLHRRTYLTLGAAALGATALSGFSRAQSDGTLRYGYGGAPYLLPIEPTEAAEAEPNDACFDAQPIAQNATVSGTLEDNGVDWYGIDLREGAAVDVVFDREPTAGVTGVVVYGPDCEFRTMRQVGHDGSVRLGLVPRSAGTHYVQVVDVEAGEGAYEVLVEPTDGLADPTPADEDVYGTQDYGEQGFGGVPV